jgi:hypothetical protein
MKLHRLLPGVLVFAFSSVFAQPQMDPKTIDKTFSISGGGTFSKPKMMSKMDKLALAQTSIYFKTATTREIIEHERGAFGRRKTDGGSVAGRLTAYLETSDGELTESDFQQVADEFYVYLAKRLNETGVATVDWNTIAATDFYKDGSDLEDIRQDLDKMKKKGQIFTVVNANQGKTMYKYNILGGLNTGFAFGKAVKAGKFASALGAPVVWSHITVDFADILLDGDVKTGTKNESNMFYTKITKTKKFKMDAEVGAKMKVTANGGPSYFWNEKSQTELMNIAMDIPSDIPFATSVEQDAEKQKLRKKDNLFAKDFNMTPVVITTTKEKYKQAAKKTLENYADMLVAKIQMSKK